MRASSVLVIVIAAAFVVLAAFHARQFFSGHVQRPLPHVLFVYDGKIVMPDVAVTDARAKVAP